MTQLQGTGVATRAMGQATQGFLILLHPQHPQLHPIGKGQWQHSGHRSTILVSASSEELCDIMHWCLIALDIFVGHPDEIDELY